MRQYGYIIFRTSRSSSNTLRLLIYLFYLGKLKGIIYYLFVIIMDWNEDLKK